MVGRRNAPNTTEDEEQQTKVVVVGAIFGEGIGGSHTFLRNEPNFYREEN